ncbi:hypothetical protein BG006_005015 [Podila minutissima]|uniref:Major facilitator superfamily (MFS) profile domain-containing protein n=1 Tax=Podila minutissima TaxID=64525 RepID=A0A9P5STE3_9FUNG|nr:hypothetical protein BG006_005015 [Podila minutissima]
MSQQHDAPSSSTVIAIPSQESIAMTRESTLAPTTLKAEPSSSRLENLRIKLSPLLLYVVSTAQFLDIVNGASVAVALLPIAEDLDFKAAEALWILNAYTITFAGLLLVSGRLGDLFGHRRMFMFGLFWFTLWALVVSFSTSSIMFILARALQGMGAAATVPTAMALIAINYPPGPERTKAFSVFAAFGGLGAVTGILLAGGLISSIGWEWIFRISAIVGAFLLVLGFFTIPEAPRKAEKPKVDFLGAVMSTLGVTGVVYYISTGVEEGWADAKTLPVLIAGLALLVGFVFLQSKVDSPLMPLRIWKSRTFSASFVLAFISFGSFQGIIYYVNMVFQQVYGWGTLKTAVGFLVHALLAIVVFGILGRVLPRLPLKPIILTGFLLRCVTALMFAFVTQHTSYWHIAFPALIIHIFGVGFSQLPIQLTAVRDAANADQGLVGALYNTGLQLGAPFGIAVLNVISLSTNGSDNSEVRGGPALMKGYKNAFFTILAMTLFAFVLTLVILPWDKPVRAAIKPEAVKDVEAAESSVSVENIEEQKVGESAVEGSKIELESDASTIASLNEVSEKKF